MSILRRLNLTEDCIQSAKAATDGSCTCSGELSTKHNRRAQFANTRTSEFQKVCRILIVDIKMQSAEKANDSRQTKSFASL